MPGPKLTRLELQIMEALWNGGSSSIREIQETFPEKHRPAYTTIQTTVYRLEAKKAVRRVRKVGNFHIFEAAVTRDAAVQVGTKKLKARARTATGAERAQLWEKALKYWPPYADYQKKTEREIPVVVLDPVA